MAVQRDKEGHEWSVRWGVSDPHDALRETFGLRGPYTSMSRSVALIEPRYNETKTLFIYSGPSGETVAMAEITPGVYAAALRS